MIRRLYSIYALLIFTILFLMLLPFFLFFILINDKHTGIFYLNRLWARLFFILIFIPVEVVYESKLPAKGKYVLCANHFSFIDIPVLGFLKYNAVFIGKSSLAKVPVFGFMFKKIHIAVDRAKLRSRSEALKKAMDVLGKGVSLIFFPEGGIVSQNPPIMGRFKDGAFRAAVEKQIPIVPVTIPFNWIVLPDDGRLLLRRHKIKVIVHRAIQAKDTSNASVEWIKNETYRIIDQELKRHFV